MNKLMQMMTLIGCLIELGKLEHRSNPARSFGEIVNFVLERLILIVLLGYGIYKGDVRIPTYFGDGYSYDNFERKSEMFFSEAGIRLRVNRSI